MMEVSAELWDALEAVAEAADRSMFQGVAGPAGGDLLHALAKLHAVRTSGLEDREVANRARMLLVDLSERHEQDVHDGAPCLDNRVGLSAFISHSVGLSPQHMARVAEELLVYEIGHGNHDPHHH